MVKLFCAILILFSCTGAANAAEVWFMQGATDKFQLNMESDNFAMYNATLGQTVFRSMNTGELLLLPASCALGVVAGVAVAGESEGALGPVAADEVLPPDYDRMTLDELTEWLNTTPVHISITGGKDPNVIREFARLMRQAHTWPVA